MLLIDHDGAALLCSSEPVFEFGLWGDPDRLLRVTAKLEEQPDPEVQLASQSTASFLKNVFVLKHWPSALFQPISD